MFRNGDAEAVSIDFLESISTDHGDRHLASDADQRDRVELGISYRRQQVGRAGAGGGETHGGVPADARHTLGDKSRSLFVPRQDMLDRVTLRQGVIERQIRSAGDAGDDANALSFEQMDDDLRAGSSYHGSTPPRVLSPGAEPGAYGVKKTPAGLSRRRGLGILYWLGLIPLRRESDESHNNNHAYRHYSGKSKGE